MISDMRKMYVRKGNIAMSEKEVMYVRREKYDA